jgi:hypothetical protein
MARGTKIANDIFSEEYRGGHAKFGRRWRRSRSYTPYSSCAMSYAPLSSRNPVAIPHISASPHRSGPRRAATLICRTFVRGSPGTIMPETGGRGKEKEGCWLTIEPRNTRTTRKMIQRRDLQMYLNSLQLHGAPLQRNCRPTARDFADSLACLRTATCQNLVFLRKFIRLVFC